MTITITAFEHSPDGGKGLARDTRVRWALEEVGQPYAVRLVSFRAMKEAAHLALHPFGQIPTYQEGDLALFETGSPSGRRRTACDVRLSIHHGEHLDFDQLLRLAQFEHRHVGRRRLVIIRREVRADDRTRLPDIADARPGTENKEMHHVLE